jgi:hypothetical protein
MKSCRYALLVAVVMTAAFWGCGKLYPELDDATLIPISTMKGFHGKEIIVEVIRGDEWEHTYHNAIFPVKVTPQFAIWAEDSKGRFLDTLYVTHKTAKQLWRNVPEGGADQPRFTEALPRWSHQRRSTGLQPPTRLMPLPDTVTAATPASSAVLYSRVLDTSGEVKIMLEINQAHDGNAAFPEDTGEPGLSVTGASGQPALVYCATVSLDKPGKYEMKLLGHSSPSGGDDSVSNDLSGVTTARDIVRHAYVIYQGR